MSAKYFGGFLTFVRNDKATGKFRGPAIVMARLKKPILRFRAKNLRLSLKRRLKAEWERQIDGIIGSRKKTVKKAKTKTTNSDKPLSGLFRHYQPIYGTYKGKDYKANVFKSGCIKLNGQLYSSPTGAAKAIVQSRTINGWTFWKYKDESGELKKIADLRK